MQLTARSDPALSHWCCCRLACGHTFCQPCIDQWSNASVSNQMRLAAERQTKMIAPECPECRGDASRKGRVKVYMLEDVVRAVQRWDEQSVREQMRLAASNIEKPPETSDNLPQELDHSGKIIFQKRHHFPVLLLFFQMQNKDFSTLKCRDQRKIRPPTSQFESFVRQRLSLYLFFPHLYQF